MGPLPLAKNNQTYYEQQEDRNGKNDTNVRPGDLSSGPLYLHECFDRHINHMENDEAWLTAETLARVGAFVDTMGQKFPIIVASVSEDMAKCALEGMREWSDTTMSVDGWPDELLQRLYSGFSYDGSSN